MNALQLRARPGSLLRGDLSLPGSKSISNRLLVMRALSGSSTELLGLSPADDTRLMAAALASKEVDKFAGPAGTVMRFLLPYLCLQSGDFRLSGSERAHERPIAPLVEALQSLGARIQYLGTAGHPPLHISGGKLQGGSIALPAHISSQFVSALLLVAPYLTQGLQLQLAGNAVSVPYIRQTVRLMQAWGAGIDWQQQQINVQPQPYQAPASFRVEPDWSAAAYWLAFTALLPGTRLQLRDLPLHTEQADKQAALWFAPFGCKLQADEAGVLLSHQSTEMPLPRVYNGKDCPDLMPTLIVLCALKGHLARFEGLESLRLKETDRIEALRLNLEAAGAQLRVDGDALQLEAGIPPGAAVVPIRCFYDHRMAMAFSLLAAAEKTVIFDQLEVVQKSYPDFWTHLQAFGFETN